MNLVTKAGLYVNTIKHLKPSQVGYRLWRKTGGNTPLVFMHRAKPDVSKADILKIPILPELDFDPVFLSRYDCDAILANRIKLLHHEEHVDWSKSWHENLSTPLWQFNLHYCEYLLPLANTYLEKKDVRYLKKAQDIILSWIDSNPRSGRGIGWDPYVISMRIVNWLAFYGEIRSYLEADETFVEKMNVSLAEQFEHLSVHLEKDLLANHYLENLKALVLLSLYFDDMETLALALKELKSQIEEQILPDGMHFELSPMYHKIVLEDLLRIAFALEKNEIVDAPASFCHLQDMCDCLYSMERNTNRTPLFNDSGDNVAKSRDSLLWCANNIFEIEPAFRADLPDAGYYIIEKDTAVGPVKAIFDAGAPGPQYAMGHAHCDALSFECFVKGEPWIINCGTYAYQDERRLDFKGVLFHSTVCVEGEEQHECWAPFRVAGYSRACLLEGGAHRAAGVLTQRGSGAEIKRTIILEEESILVREEFDPTLGITRTLIFAHDAPRIDGAAESVPYASDFGSIRLACRIVTDAQGGCTETRIPYPGLKQRKSR